MLRGALCGGAAAMLLIISAITSYSATSRAGGAVALVSGRREMMVRWVGGGRMRAGAARGVKARQTMLRGLGAGPEQDSENDWHVAMALDSGCQDQLDAKESGNVAWRQIGDREPCIPNKRVNPMQWPYDSPGQTWLSAGDKGGYVLPTDSAKSPKEWPYNHKDLDDFVYRAEKESPTVDWTDGVWHGNAPPEGEHGDQVDKAAGGKA